MIQIIANTRSWSNYKMQGTVSNLNCFPVHTKFSKNNGKYYIEVSIHDGKKWNQSKSREINSA